tara:strand:+ start:71 stop:226 length:156 start_codon:yes stop_codon:yes gene_type:complete
MNSIKPLIGVGTVLPIGTVEAINNDHVLLRTSEGVQKLSFAQVERFINNVK